MSAAPNRKTVTGNRNVAARAGRVILSAGLRFSDAGFAP